MTPIIFATNNQNKALEINKLLGEEFIIKTLKESGINEDIPETSNTLEGNAIQKARYVFDRLGKDCFADDTGLEIHALGGAPGVLSARYAGSQRDSDQNMAKVMGKLQGATDRSAQFKTVICLYIGGEQHLFEGICEGVITEAKSGAEGFGYDPIFQPSGYQTTFAEMTMEDKNKISHRGRAIRKMITFLKNYEG